MTPRSRAPVVALTAIVSLGIAVFFSLYSLIPLTAERGQSSLPVGTMMTFVMGVQVFTPALVRRFSLRGVAAGSISLLAIGALVVGLANGMPLLLVGAVLAGSGFGLLVVLGAQGVALLTDPAKLGRALSVYGLITMAASALGAPAGVQLALSFSPTVFGVSALIVGLLGVVLMFGIPATVGRDAAHGDAADNAADSADAPQPVSRRLRSLLGGAPWLVLGLLVLSMTMFSHGLSSLPSVAAAYANVALVVFAVQAGNALGRGVGGWAEYRLGPGGAMLAAAVVVAAAGSLGVLLPIAAAALASGALIGFGVGVVQTVSLHTAMRRMDAGRASVVWNIMVDAGLWVGGMLWGMALAHGFVDAGVFAIAAAAFVIGAVISLQLRSEQE